MKEKKLKRQYEQRGTRKENAHLRVDKATRDHLQELAAILEKPMIEVVGTLVLEALEKAKNNPPKADGDK
jgi:hypothetical protein